MIVCLQVCASGRETVQDGQANQGRAPRKDDVLEFEMAEPDSPGGVEWLHGTVVKVDAKKKKFTVVIKNDEEDDSTWNEETYSVHESRCLLSGAFKKLRTEFLHAHQRLPG